MDVSKTVMPICRQVRMLASACPYVSCMCAASFDRGTCSWHACSHQHLLNWTRSCEMEPQSLRVSELSKHECMYQWVAIPLECVSPCLAIEKDCSMPGTWEMHLHLESIPALQNKHEMSSAALTTTTTQSALRYSGPNDLDKQLPCTITAVAVLLASQCNMQANFQAPACWIIAIPASCFPFVKGFHESSSDCMALQKDFNRQPPFETSSGNHVLRDQVR